MLFIEMASELCLIKNNALLSDMLRSSTGFEWGVTAGHSPTSQPVTYSTANAHELLRLAEAVNHAFGSDPKSRLPSPLRVRSAGADKHMEYVELTIRRQDVEPLAQKIASHPPLAEKVRELKQFVLQQAHREPHKAAAVSRRFSASA